MAKNKRIPAPEQSYSPEFKLRVVLEYLRDPKQARHICHENHISEELLVAWHQAFVARAGDIFGDSNSSHISQAPDARYGSVSYQTFVTAASESGFPWGIRINAENYRSSPAPSTTKEPPGWLGPVERETWYKRGTVIWDNISQRMAVLFARDALRILDTLRQTDHWRKEGIPIIRQVARFPIPESPGRKEPEPKQTRKSQKNKTAVQTRPEQVAAEVELFRLDPKTGPAFLAFLLEHESLLKRMEDEDRKEGEALWKEAFELLIGGFHESEGKELNLSSRPLPWVRDELSQKWVCDAPPNRGTVTLTENSAFWQGCIEQPDRFKNWSPIFLYLEEALSWAEQELFEIQKAEAEAAMVKEKKESSLPSDTRSKPKMDLTLYRIDPAMLEPEQITYRVVIDLDHEPETFKTMELSFGKMDRYAEKFPTPNKLARELLLDLSQVTIDQPLGRFSHWYRVLSTSTYHVKHIVAAQAQQLLDRSAILQQYNDKRITRAHFGFMEVGTDYCVWLGSLEDPGKSWGKQESREEHMTSWAIQETLAYALDVDGFREFLVVSPELFSDEELLGILHARRSRSNYVAANARAESEQWLHDHAEVKTGAK